METSTVAVLIKYFNTALIVVLALFAAYGAVAVFRRKVLRVDAVGGKGKAAKSQKAAAGGGYTLWSAFCVAALAAFAVEATFFNFQHYLKLFAGPELEIVGVSSENPNVFLTSAGTLAELLYEGNDQSNASNAGVVFRNLAMKVTSLFVDLEFNDAKTAEMTVQWTDEQSTYSFKKRVLKYFPHDNYLPLQSSGNVSELTVMFESDGPSLEITQIALNKKIPFYFSGLRLVVASILLFAFFCFLRKELRAEAAYYLFEYKFNPANRKQSLIHALSIVGLILFSWVCVNTSYTKSYMNYETHQQYNRFLVDALANGRTWLNFGHPENLLKAERPYDNNYRIANGYKFNSDVMWDWAWYKGKFYCYFGVVPAVILYLPYKLVTGEYLSIKAGIVLFFSFMIILMAMLWRFCVKKYMPNAGFVFYMLSFLTLFFAGGIFTQLRYTRVYSMVQPAGLMFALAGCLLLLKSVENEKINRLKLFFACLCLALVVGCRPNMIFVSFLVPFVLWKYRSWKLFAFILIPYLMVAIPLCAYNYARFDSIFEFGARYNLTGSNVSTFRQLNLLGQIIRTFWDSAIYLLIPNKYSLYFPFVECFQADADSNITLGMFNYIGPGSGMINFPIVFCLLYLFKNILDKKIDYVARLSLVFIAIAAVIITVNSFLLGFGGRYTFDFAVYLILPSLFYAYRWCASHSSALQNKDYRMSIVHILLAVSIFVGSFLCVSGGFPTQIYERNPYDPVLYRYLECSLGVFRNV